MELWFSVDRKFKYFSCRKTTFSEQFSTLPVFRKDMPWAIQVDNHHNHQYDISNDSCVFHMDIICYNSSRIATLGHHNSVPEHCCHTSKIVCFSSNTVDTCFYRGKPVHTHEFHTLISTCTEKEMEKSWRKTTKFPSNRTNLGHAFPSLLCAAHRFRI